MSYRFKGQKVIINGEEQVIVPGPLPDNPENGYIAVDESDGFLKVYNENFSRWLSFPGDSLNRQNIQFQYIGTMNFDQYMYPFSDVGGINRRSGDESNGYRYGNSAPIASPFSGKIKNLTVIAQGLATSTGSPSATVTLNLELWKVGFTNEGTKLGDLDVSINSSNFTIGTWWNSSVDTNFSGNRNDLDISVSRGDLLGLKFKRVTGSSNIVSADNVTVLLQIEEDL